MKHKKISFVAFVLTVCILVSTFAVSVFAEKNNQADKVTLEESSTEVIADSNENTITKEMSEENTDTEISEKSVIKSEYQLIPKIDKYVTANSEASEIKIDNRDVVDYNIVTDGVEVVSSSTDTGKIQFSAIDEFGILTIEAVFQDGSKSQCKFYTYKTDTETY